MKTLANAKDKEEIVQRLRGIRPESQRRWGKMTAPEMVCHLSDAFRISMGQKAARPARTVFTRTLFKWAGLWFPTRWPHGVRTVPECDPKLGGSSPAEFESDLGELWGLLDRFTRQPDGFQWAAHPIFGPMSEKEWMRWGYLHMDHHLRQFCA
jgi:hypothetical protein